MLGAENENENDSLALYVNSARAAGYTSQQIIDAVAATW